MSADGAFSRSRLLPSLLGIVLLLMGLALLAGGIKLSMLGGSLYYLLAGIGLMLLSVGTVLLCALVVMLFAEGYRVAALAVLTVAFLAGGVLTMRAGGHRLHSPGGVFRATLAELAQDRADLAPRE